jgi:glutamine amidotransferase
LACVGVDVPMDHLLLDAPNALVRQAWAPRRQHHGVVNADGFGLGWYPAPGVRQSVEGEPLRHRGFGPVWADETFTELARGQRPTGLLASVRSATPGMGHGVASAMPFRHGRLLFGHNGAIAGWPDAAAPLVAGLDPRWLLRMDAVTDAAFLWAMVLARIADGAEPANAVPDVVRTVRAECGGRLNLLVTDGERIVATAAGASLSYLLDTDPPEAGRPDRGWTVVASEPVDDDPRWVDVPDGSLVEASPDGVTVTPL